MKVLLNAYFFKYNFIIDCLQKYYFLVLVKNEIRISTSIRYLFLIF